MIFSFNKKKIALMWTLSHVGISGNELPDKLIAIATGYPNTQLY